MKIRLYTTDKCPFCKEMREYFEADNIEFTEVNVLKAVNKAEFDKIREVSGADSVPIILVGKNILVPDRSFRTIKEGFEITKKILSDNT
mgnify:CR=1 FL=1